MRQDLEDNLFDINSEYEDCECNSDHVNHRSVSVFDKSSYEEMSEMSCDDNPFRTKKKQLAGFLFVSIIVIFYRHTQREPLLRREGKRGAES